VIIDYIDKHQDFYPGINQNHSNANLPLYANLRHQIFFPQNLSKDMVAVDDASTSTTRGTSRSIKSKNKNTTVVSSSAVTGPVIQPIEVAFHHNLNNYNFSNNNNHWHNRRVFWSDLVKKSIKYRKNTKANSMALPHESAGLKQYF
jgi:hypothetical protein